MSTSITARNAFRASLFGVFATALVVSIAGSASGSMPSGSDHDHDLAMHAQHLAGEPAATSSHASCPFHSSHEGGDDGATPGSPLAVPSSSGQSAFAAIGEIASMLEGDPATDWSRVDLDRLREHLIDMNRVMVMAEIDKRNIPGGFEAAITGDPRTALAAQRMLSAHGQMMKGHRGWSIAVEKLTDGARLQVTAKDPQETQHLRALGFAGFLAAGNHHGPHHWAMATGGDPHRH